MTEPLSIAGGTEPGRQAVADFTFHKGPVGVRDRDGWMDVAFYAPSVRPTLPIHGLLDGQRVRIGMTASSAGSFDVTIAAAGATSVTKAVTVTAVVPTLSFANATYTAPEGDSGTKLFAMQMTRSTGAGALAVTGIFGAGDTEPQDFAGDVYPANPVFNFADGATTAIASIAVKSDTEVEPDEHFTVTIQAPAGYALGANPTATVTIVNDDVAPPPVGAGNLQRISLAQSVARGESLAGAALVGVTAGSTLELVTNGYQPGASYAGITVDSAGKALGGVADRPSVLLRETGADGSARHNLLFFPKAGKHRMTNGVNLPFWNYYTPNRLLMDRMKFSGALTPAGTTDANQMPLTIDPAKGNVQYLTSVGLAGEPATNYAFVTDADWDVQGFVKVGDEYVKAMPAGFSVALINITAIRKAPTYMALVKESEVAAYKAGKRFQAAAIEMLSKFKHIRAMNVHGGNFAEEFTAGVGNVSYADSNQCPLPVLVDLCIEAKIGLWINVHHKTDIETTFKTYYLPQLDRLVAAGLPVYVEHTNEIWNGQFLQNGYGNQIAIDMGWTENTYTGSTWWHGIRTAQIGIACRGRGYNVSGGVQTVSQNDLQGVFWRGFNTVPGANPGSPGQRGDLSDWYITNYASGTLTLGLSDAPLGTIQDGWVANHDYDSLFDNLLNNTMPVPSAESYASRASLKHYAEAKAIADAHGMNVVTYEGSNFHLNKLPYARNNAYGPVFYAMPEQALAYNAINQILEDSEEGGIVASTAFDLDSGSPGDSPYGRFGLYGLPGFDAIEAWNANVDASAPAPTPAPSPAPTPAPAPGTTAWTPTDLSKPVLGWWDMQASSTTLAGSDITVLGGVGGRPDATQTDAGKRPSLATTGWDDTKPCAVFAAGDILDTPVSGAGALSETKSKPFTYVSVVEWDRTAYLGLTMSATPGAHNAYVDSAGKLYLDKQGVENVYASPADTVKAGKSIIIVRFDGDALNTVSVNGVPVTFASVAVFGVEGTMQIGNGGPGKIDKLAAVLRIDGAVSDDELRRLEGYCANRWSMAASLPAAHPYKSSPPTK